MPPRTRTAGLSLPVVEQIDPALVPELFWRALAGRPPAIGDSPSLDHVITAGLVRPRCGPGTARRPDPGWNRPMIASWGVAGARWSWAGRSSIPRPAVDGSRGSPSPRSSNGADDYSRHQVAEFLGLPYDRRSQRFWHYYTEMRDLFDRDLH